MATISNPVARFQYLVGRSDTFRTLVGATTGDEAAKLAAARAAAHLLMIDWTSSASTLPCCVLDWGDDRGYRRENKETYLPRFDVVIVWYKAVTLGSGADNIETQQYDFDDLVNTIVQEMLDLGGTLDHIWSTSNDYLGHEILANESNVRDRIIQIAWRFSGEQWGAQSE